MNKDEKFWLVCGKTSGERINACSWWNYKWWGVSYTLKFLGKKSVEPVEKAAKNTQKFPGRSLEKADKIGRAAVSKIHSAVLLSNSRVKNFFMLVMD